MTIHFVKIWAASLSFDLFNLSRDKEKKKIYICILLLVSAKYTFFIRGPTIRSQLTPSSWPRIFSRSIHQGCWSWTRRIWTAIRRAPAASGFKWSPEKKRVSPLLRHCPSLWYWTTLTTMHPCYPWYHLSPSKLGKRRKSWRRYRFTNLLFLINLFSLSYFVPLKKKNKKWKKFEKKEFYIILYYTSFL